MPTTPTWSPPNSTPAKKSSPTPSPATGPDVPAITTRTDLAARLQHVDPRLIGRGDLGPVTDLILTPDALRRLVAERHQLRHFGVDTHVHRPQQLQQDQTSDKQALTAGQRQRHRVLRGLNNALERRQQRRPFQRSERRHLDQQIMEAEAELRRIGTALDTLRRQLDRRRPELDAETQWLRDHRRDVGRYQELNRRLNRRLNHDATARAQAIAPKPRVHVVRLVGPRPKTAGTAQDAWERSVGLIEQHRITYGTTGADRVVDSYRSATVDDRTRDAAEVRAACRAAKQLNPEVPRSLGRGQELLDRAVSRRGPTLGR